VSHFAIHELWAAIQVWENPIALLGYCGLLGSSAPNPWLTSVRGMDLLPEDNSQNRHDDRKKDQLTIMVLKRRPSMDNCFSFILKLTPDHQADEEVKREAKW